MEAAGSNAKAQGGDDFVAELGAFGPEITALLQQKPQRPKKKKVSKTEIEDEAKKMAEVDMAMLTNRLYAKYITKLERKLKDGGKKKRTRKQTDPTGKQKAQWKRFASRVSVAKQHYYNQSDRSVEAWQVAMQKAYAGGTGESGASEGSDARMEQ